jgi:glycosyltransferase involved in cell wall biosynthesis
MRILQVISYFNPKFGGDVNSTFNLSKYLSKNSHDVTIITTDFGFDKEYVKSMQKEHVTVIPFHCVFNIGLFIVTPSIKKWVKKNIKDFDIVHMNNFRSYQNNVVCHYAMKYNIPYILQARGSVLPFFQKQKLKKLYDAVWGNEILKNANMVVALTNAEREQYKQLGVNEERIEVVPNGLDLTIFDRLPQKGTFRDKYNIASDAKIVLFLGRLHKIKGIDFLIDAFSEVQKEVPTSKLVIVGPDEGYLKNLKNQADESTVESNILFTGPLYGQDKLAAYLDASVYVLPSIFEVFGNTVLEAWACGTPVIVTNGCFISDIVENAGFSVKYNKEELRRSICNILNDEALRVKFAENGKKLVVEKFDLNIVIKKIEKIYNDCAKM